MPAKKGMQSKIFEFHFYGGRYRASLPEKAVVINTQHEHGEVSISAHIETPDGNQPLIFALSPNVLFYDYDYVRVEDAD